VSRYQKCKTSLDFTEARDSEWQWHQLGLMQVCTSLQTDNHASTPPLKFITGRMPFLLPNQQRQSTRGKRHMCVNNLPKQEIIITLPVIIMFECCSVKVKILQQRRGHECRRRDARQVTLIMISVTYSQQLSANTHCTSHPSALLSGTANAGLMVQWLRCWLTTQKVSGSTPAVPLFGNNLGQVVHTHVPLSPISIIWYRSSGHDALRLGR